MSYPAGPMITEHPDFGDKACSETPGFTYQFDLSVSADAPIGFLLSDTGYLHSLWLTVSRVVIGRNLMPDYPEGDFSNVSYSLVTGGLYLQLTPENVVICLEME